MSGREREEAMRSFKVVKFGQPLCEQTGSLPAPKGTEVLLRVSACGVCHSDLHILDGRFDLGGGQVMDLSRSVQLPRTLGHEIVGEVCAVGPEVQGARLGDRRIVFPWIGCGECSICRAGAEHLCGRPRALGANADGGFSDHVLVPHARYLVGYEGVPEHIACTFACSGLTAFSALRKAPSPAEGDRVLIIGAGGVGLAAIRLAKHVLGITPVVAEIDRGKWDAAKEAGASDVVDPADPEVRKVLIRSTGGFATAFDFVGARETAEFGTAVLRKGGRLIVVGLIGGSLGLPLPALVMRSIGVIGSFVGSLDDLRELVGVAKTGWWRSLPVTRRPLDDAQRSLDDLRERRIIGRVVLTP